MLKKFKINMKAVKRILCPYDFSEYSLRSLDWALKLNTDAGCPLSILYVLSNPIYLENGNPITGIQIYSDKILEELRLDTQKQLNELLSKLKGQYPMMSIDLIYKEAIDIGECVLETQTEIGADLIIMGSHGHKGIKRFLMGSIAEDVLRNSKFPVVIVK